MSLLVEFGSTHHGCYDKYSDRDVLLLYSNIETINQEKGLLKDAGYSVTSFSVSKARYLARSGSLFFRHVFFEGKVIDGEKELFECFKSLWSPLTNYDQEIEENIDLLSVLEALPNTTASNIVINDILICSIRNILIRKLANQGIYVFSWKAVFRESLKRQFIKKSCVPDLLRARRYKNMYRRGLLPNISDSFIRNIEEISQEVIDPRRKIRIGSHKEIIMLPEKYNDGSYAQLRAIELLCSYYDFDKSMERYRSITTDPSYFCSVGPNE